MDITSSKDLCDRSAGPDDRRQLHPLPRGLVELYGLIAVLMVLIPEWLADGTINIGQATRPEHACRCVLGPGEYFPELRLAAMSLKEMRQLASEMRLVQYGNQSKGSTDLAAHAETTRTSECTVITCIWRGVAQRVAHHFGVVGVVGSNPAAPIQSSKPRPHRFATGHKPALTCRLFYALRA